MAETPERSEPRDPAEGAREDVNVPNAADQAETDPNGLPPKAKPKRASTRRRPTPARVREEAEIPPRDESRESETETNPHRPRRSSL